MKIKGVWGEFDAPYVRALFICEGLNLKEHIEFLIDSGASRTTILDNDAIMLGIDHDHLENKHSLFLNKKKDVVIISDENG